MVLVFPGVLSHQQLQDHQETILLHFSPTTQPPFLQQQIFTLYTCTVLLQLSNTILYNHFYNSKVSPSTVLYTSSTNNPITYVHLSPTICSTLATIFTTEMFHPLLHLYKYISSPPLHNQCFGSGSA